MHTQLNSERATTEKERAERDPVGNQEQVLRAKPAAHRGRTSYRAFTHLACELDSFCTPPRVCPMNLTGFRSPQPLSETRPGNARAAVRRRQRQGKHTRVV